MSKRLSFIGKSPREDPTETFNPYETVNLESQRREMFQKYNAPKVIIDDDPVVPNYEVQESFRKHASHNVKLVVVGDGGCGKTCLLVSYAQNRFPEIYVPTVFENYVTNVMAPNNKLIELALWDTAGQEEYDRLRPLSYPDVDVLLICFALDSLVSLQNVKDTWFPEVSHFCPGIPIILVGTKSDLQSQIDPDLPIQVATEINAIGYIQCSAKTMFNIRTVFNFALNHYQKQVEIQEQYEKSKNRLSKVLHGSNGGSFGSAVGGHTRNQSSISNRRGHFKNTSYDSTLLLDQPLAEDTYTHNPYGNFGSPHVDQSPRYNEEEFAFTRDKKKKKKKSKRCTIL
ncbi:GTP-binding protein (RHO4) [Scheffersomyces stipitis CBS 6054]|uniref:GTP-binding protein (RHO4) n=1 Tax=Scheffersomyces stipitis (strain ATCC 58785 / CBS 6054 / NBRC 10063 / NRRL Y-11545) TaxID=322104 RepID=A3GFH9_PICST|nr:GTP-binding protein (RHO4) [Scheffersomyces stipitis CBS 6054]EAZ63348.2 GTP-binding protein (RHO4) [Scheffersomyces stipitis CBS 6054]KAG2731719.1 hypothetical protein G9P44_005306 [Scheffersomyces stipitis]